MTTLTLNVPAISCGHCVHTIQNEVSELPGVTSVKADQKTRVVVVDYAPPATPEAIEARLAEINYPAEKLMAL
jgi:copper chaperone CopZ